MMELISNILGAIGNFFKWKSSGVAQYDAAEKRVSEREASVSARKAAVNRAVHEGDAQSVNRFLNSCLEIACGLCFMTGCLSSPPTPQYVAADRVITCTTNEEGRAVMWHVPPLVMEDLLNSKVELDEMKRENKIKEITK